jgi:kynurenine formamidase
MKYVDLTIPIGIATPPWPTYEPLQVKHFKRLTPLAKLPVNTSKDRPFCKIFAKKRSFRV